MKRTEIGMKPLRSICRSNVIQKTLMLNESLQMTCDLDMFSNEKKLLVKSFEYYIAITLELL